MSKIQLKKENISNLEKRLTDLYKERFKLLIEKTNGTQFKKKHVFNKIKLDIARILTSINKIKREEK
ncbi:MAG TPA: 50S ribosomal protein L29 [Candidatus Azoamicus sp. MARI]